MKRDMDLVRWLLLEIRDLPADNNIIRNESGEETDEINEHLYLMQQAGLIEATAIGLEERFVPLMRPIRLTWAGHELAEAIVSDDRWARLRNKMAQVGGFVLGVAEPLAIEWMKREVGLG